MTTTAPAPLAAPAADRPAPDRFAALDGLRAVAALAVVATHAGFQTGRSLDDGPAAPFLARLDFGVTVFFLLSGFLLYRPHVAAALAGRPRPDLRRYTVRRLVRILPAYWVVVAVTLGAASTVRHGAGDWAAFLTLTQTYGQHGTDPMLTQMWSLVVELGFYALLPLLAVLALGRGRASGRRQVAVLGGLVAVATAWSALATAGVVPTAEARLWLPGFLDWFAAGMALAAASGWLRSGRPARRLGALTELASAPLSCWAVALLLFWLATLPVAGPRSLVAATGPEWFVKHWLYLGAAVFLLLPAVLGGPGSPVVRALGSRPMRFLGEISYGIFLWHLTLLMLLRSALGMRLFTGSFVELYAGTVGATLVAATVSYYALERPLMRRAARWARAPEAPTLRSLQRPAP